MKKIRICKISKSDVALLVVLVISLYVMASYVFPDIRISYSCLGAEATDLFNNVMLSLASGYVVSYITYLLSVVYKNHLQRNRFFWTIYGYMMDLFNAWNTYKETISKEGDADNMDSFCETMICEKQGGLHDNSDVTIKKEICKEGVRCSKNIDEIICKLMKYDDYLTEEEKECLKVILNCTAHLNNGMVGDYEQKTTYKTLKILWFGSFAKCDNTIKRLNNSIVNEARN